MTRVRFDPSFVEHERWERLGLEALALHLHAVSYTTRTLADGILSPGRVRVLTPLVAAPEDVAARLVDEGLWTVLEDGTFQVCAVHDDLRRADGRGDEQPSRAFVEKERDRARERKETWKRKNAEGNGVPSGVRNSPQSSAEQSSAVQDPKGPSPASAGAQVVGLSAAKQVEGNSVPTCVPTDAPPGVPPAVWESAWQRAAGDLPPEQRKNPARVSIGAVLLLKEQPQAATG